MVWRVINFLVTSRPCRTCGIWRTARKADKPAVDRRSTNHVSAWKLRHCLRKRMAASGTCLQVLTALFTLFTTSQYLEATKEEKEQNRWYFWTKQARSSDNNVIVIVIPFLMVEKYIYFRKLRKVHLQTFGRCEIFTHDKFPSYFYNKRTTSS